MDFKGPFGRLIATLLGAIAEFELGCRAQRQKLKRSRCVAISPSGVKVKVPSMMLCTLRPVALKR